MNPQPTALVTGGARRIGAQIVRELAAHGYAVAIHCHRSFGDAQALATEIVASGGRAAVVRGDLAQAETLKTLVPAAVEALGPLTLLVNNASIFARDAYGGLDIATWQAQLDTNLRAPVFLAESFAAQLPEGWEGNVVNLIDQRVLKLTPEMPSYMLSKSALWTATRTLAQAYAPRIRVNAVGPGPTFANPYAKDGGMRREIAGTLLKRRVEAADIARAVRFLAETPSITGQLLLLDSGQHLAWKTADIEDAPA